MPCTGNSDQQHCQVAQALGCKPRLVLSQYRAVRFTESSEFPARNTIHSLSSPFLLCGIWVLRLSHQNCCLQEALLPGYDNLRLTLLLIHSVSLGNKFPPNRMQKSLKMCFRKVSQTRGLKQII